MISEREGGATWTISEYPMHNNCRRVLSPLDLKGYTSVLLPMELGHYDFK
jgi:hypothetical protein